MLEVLQPHQYLLHVDTEAKIIPGLSSWLALALALASPSWLCFTSSGIVVVFDGGTGPTGAALELSNILLLPAALKRAWPRDAPRPTASGLGLVEVVLRMLEECGTH